MIGSYAPLQPWVVRNQHMSKFKFHTHYGHEIIKSCIQGSFIASHSLFCAKAEYIY